MKAPSRWMRRCWNAPASCRTNRSMCSTSTMASALPPMPLPRRPARAPLASMARPPVSPRRAILSSSSPMLGWKRRKPEPSSLAWCWWTVPTARCRRPCVFLKPETFDRLEIMPRQDDEKFSNRLDTAAKARAEMLAKAKARAEAAKATADQRAQERLAVAKARDERLAARAEEKRHAAEALERAAREEQERVAREAEEA